MIQLPYGTGYLELNLPPESNYQVLAPESAHYQAENSQEELVRQSLANPIESAKLADMVKGKQKIVLITSDHTRPVPSHITLPILLEEIKQANNSAEITLLISTGTHRPTTEEEMLNKFGRKVLDQVKVVNHLSDRTDDMVFLGTLPSGGELWINKLAIEADLLISEGFIEPHFFAGFSGGRKSVLPGIASTKTVFYNHNAQFIASPYARAGVLDQNPIHKDMVWAARQAKLAFILNVVINEKKEIINCFAGHPIKAHEQGCDFVRRLTSVKAVPGDIVISTNGGYPLDQNVYQAVKGMTAAESSAKPEAVIIMVSRCGDGLGGDHFFHMLSDYPTPQAAIEPILSIPPAETIQDQWEAQILARILIKHKVIMVCDQATAENVQKMHMDYASSIDEALAKAIAIKGKDATITVIPDGVGIIVEKLV